MRFKFRTLAIATAVAAAATVTVTTPADAYQSIGCKWNHKSIRFYVPAPLVSASVWSAAAASWSGLDAKYVMTGTSPDMTGTNENRGNTVPWSGITRKPGTVQAAPSCTNGWYQSRGVQVALNWSAMTNAGYSAADRRMVAAHELGHTFGLAHTPNHSEWLMYPEDDRTVLTPQPNDKAGVNALY